MSEDIKALVLAAQDKLQEVAPKWLSVERLTRLALAMRSRNPMIAECAPDSFLLFCMRCAETGLEPIGAGGAWAVPFMNNKRRPPVREIQWIADWRGLIFLAKRTNQIKHAYGDIVCEHDEIEYQKGDDPRLSHKPNLKGRGGPIGAYCIVVLPDDTKHIEYMTFDEIEAIRSRSKAKDSGPWVTDWGQMAIKTVVKRALKPFAASPEMQTAINLDNAAVGLDLPEERPPVQMPKELPQGEESRLIDTEATMAGEQPRQEELPIDEDEQIDDALLIEADKALQKLTAAKRQKILGLMNVEDENISMLNADGVRELIRLAKASK